MSREDGGRRLRRLVELRWKSITSVTDPERVKNMREFLIQARDHLEAGQISDGFDAYHRAGREYTLARIHHQVYYYRSTKGMLFALGLMFICTVGVLAVWLFEGSIQLDGRLLLALFGGGLGGCAAVLVQVIDVTPDSEVVSKAPWYVIKPVLGAVLGLVTYFVLVSGIGLASGSSSEVTPQAAVVVGFLAGFFESFSKGILARAVGALTNTEAGGTGASGRTTAATVKETAEQPD